MVDTNSSSNCQLHQMKSDTSTSSEVNAVQSRRRNVLQMQKHDDMPEFSCYRCGKVGHMANDCHQKVKDVLQMCVCGTFCIVGQNKDA